jgi:hypothetical protein
MLTLDARRFALTAANLASDGNSAAASVPSATDRSYRRDGTPGKGLGVFFFQR